MILLLFLNLNAVPAIPIPVVAAFDYAALELKAAALLVKFGRLTILRRISKAPANPSEPWQGTVDVKTDTNVTAVFLDYSLEDQEFNIIQRGDQRVFMRGNLGIDVTDQDHVVDGTNEWAIINVQPLNPGGTTLLYELQLRQ